MNLAQAFRNRFPQAQVVKRTKNSIHLETSPGHFVAELNSGAIHYGPNADLECDTSWVPATLPWQYQMTSADYHAFALANFSSGQILRYLHPASGESITFQPQPLQWTNSIDQIQAIANPASIVATVTDDILRWNGAYGAGRDFIWQTSTDLLAKELILAAIPPAPPQFIIDGGNPVLRLQFIIGLSAGVTAFVDGVAWNRQATVTTGNLVEFRDDGGNVLWRFKAATATDANGNAAPNVLTRFRRAGNSLFVEARVPYSWLQAAAYPVSIDPTVEIQPDATAGKDTFIAADNVPTANFGIATNLSMGNQLSAARLRRGLLQFDISSIPAGATVNSGLLTLYIESEDDATDRDVGMHRALTQWYEGAKNGTAPDGGQDGSTWNLRNANGSVAWAGGAGGGSGSDYAASATATTTITGTGITFDWDVAADVQAWIDGANNYGWWGINTTENAVSIKRATSSDGTTAGNRPKLTIIYTEAAAGIFPIFVPDGIHSAIFGGPIVR